MANRHLSRSIVMQTLFEWDFRALSEKDIPKIFTRIVSEFAPGTSDTPYMEKLLNGILAKQKDLDDIIGKAAPEWPIEKISIVDRNILRLGLYELLFGDRNDVPPKVAINESIELAKSFGGDTSGKFVNGVLGTVYKEIGEPGKNETSKIKKTKEQIDIKKLPIEKLGGAVVYAYDTDGNIKLAFVHDVFGYWTLSKGHIEEGETVEEGTRREIKEETNLSITIEKNLGSNEYIASDPKKGKIRKQVNYFLAEAKYEPVKLSKVGGLDDVRWFSLDEVTELKMYDDILPIITRGIEKINKN